MFIIERPYISEYLNLPMGYVRSGNKDHGRQNKIEGHYEKGNKVEKIYSNTEGNLVNGISHIYAMKSECEAYDVTGAALNAGAIRLKPQWQGTGWDEQSVRLLGDFGSRVYHFKMKEE